MADDLLSATQCECGRQFDECGDESRTWYPQRRIDYARREEMAANHAYDALHEEMPFHDGTETSWSRDRNAGHPYHYRDGVSIYVADVDLNPDDQFLSRTRAYDDEGEVDSGDSP